MAKLSVSDAARVADVARSTLHRALRAGRLSADPDGKIDTAELLRAGYTLQRSTQQNVPVALQDATPRDRSAPQHTTPAQSQALTQVTHERDLLRMERDLLRQTLEAAHTREQAALEREQEARARESLLLRMLEQVQQQNQRLLDVGRSPAVSPGGRASREASAPRGAMRQPSGYDPMRYYLGSLCARGHDYQESGHSLRRKGKRDCRQCTIEGKRQARQRQPRETS